MHVSHAALTNFSEVETLVTRVNPMQAFNQCYSNVGSPSTTLAEH